MISDSKKRLRDPEKTRAHILETAFEEIHRRGFQGASVDKIVEKTNVTKGAFFHHFASKKDLGYALVDEYLKEMILDRWIRPLAAHKNPVQGILKRFKRLIDDFTEESIALGCPLNNLTQEMAAIDPVFQEKMQAVMTLWIDETEKYLKKAQADGFLKTSVNTHGLAELVVTMQEGAFGMAKTMRDRRISVSLYNSLKEYLDDKKA